MTEKLAELFDEKAPARAACRSAGYTREFTARGTRSLSAAIALFVLILASPALPQSARVLTRDRSALRSTRKRSMHSSRAIRARHRFGPLQFRGGLGLTSAHGVRRGYRRCGCFPMASISFRLPTKVAGCAAASSIERERPVGIEDVEMAPILGPDGRPLAARGWYDTESIAIDGRTLYVGIERVNRIVRFRLRPARIARARAADFAAAGHCESSEQPRPRMSGIRSHADAGRGHADRNLGTRSRQRREISEDS